jgi:hypothetical protein
MYWYLNPKATNVEEISPRGVAFANVIEKVGSTGCINSSRGQAIQ